MGRQGQKDVLSSICLSGQHCYCCQSICVIEIFIKWSTSIRRCLLVGICRRLLGALLGSISASHLEQRLIIGHNIR